MGDIECLMLRDQQVCRGNADESWSACGYLHDPLVKLRCL